MRCCSVYGCFNGSGKRDCKGKTFFSFPLKKPELVKIWLRNIRKENFKPGTNSTICSDHFEENAYTVCPFTKRKRLKPDAVPVVFRRKTLQVGFSSPETRGSDVQSGETKPLKPNVVPSIFPNAPSGVSSEASNARKNICDGEKKKKVKLLKVEKAVSLQERLKKEEFEKISTIQEPYQILNSHKPDYLKVVSNKSAIILLPLDANQALKTDLGIESQNVSETPIVIKQEPVESGDEPQQMVVGKPHNAAADFPSSSESSSSSSNAQPLCESFTYPSSTNMPETSATDVSSKNAEKRKITDAKLNADDDATKGTKVLCLRFLPLVPSKKNSQVHPPSGTSKKSVGPTSNGTQDKLSLRTKQPLPFKRESKLCSSAGTSKKSTGPTSKATPNKINLRATKSPMPLKRKGKLYSPAGTSKKSTGRTSNVNLADLCLRTEPSMPSKLSSKQHPPSGTSNKHTRSTPNSNLVKFFLPTDQSTPSKTTSELYPPAGTSKNCSEGDDDNATRDMFQSLIDGSESNPSFGSRTNERPGDLFDVFSDFIADKLREMEWDDCAYALRAILDVVFKAGKVQRDSEVESDNSNPGPSSRSFDMD